jgi:hypothetical protein
VYEQIEFRIEAARESDTPVVLRMMKALASMSPGWRPHAVAVG